MTTTATEELDATQELRKPGGAAQAPGAGAPGLVDWTPPAEPPAVGQAAAGPVRPRRRRRPLSFELRLLSQILLMLSVGVLGLLVYLTVITRLEQNNDQDRLYADFREQLALATAPTGGLITPGRPVALLTIEGATNDPKKKRMDQVVIEGTASADLRSGPGHLRNTPLPGQPGAAVIYGKSFTFGAPFKQINQLRPNVEITATTGQGVFHYRVTGVRRAGDSIPPKVATGAGRLTLVTEETSSGLHLPPHGHVLYVDADLVGAPQPAPGGRPQIVPLEERPMAVDGATANTTLVPWLLALALILCAMAWGRFRWGRKETLLIGAPILVAVVWNVYETVCLLLPNLL